MKLKFALFISLFLIVLAVFINHEVFNNSYFNAILLILFFILDVYVINLMVNLKQITEKNSEELKKITIYTYTQKYNQDLVNNSK